MSLGKNILRLFRGLLYPLSRIPGLGFLYTVDRNVSMGRRVAGSVNTFKNDQKTDKPQSENTETKDS